MQQAPQCRSAGRLVHEPSVQQLQQIGQNVATLPEAVAPGQSGLPARASLAAGLVSQGLWLLSKVLGRAGQGAEQAESEEEQKSVGLPVLLRWFEQEQEEGWHENTDVGRRQRREAVVRRFAGIGRSTAGDRMTWGWRLVVPLVVVEINCRATGADDIYLHVPNDFDTSANLYLNIIIIMSKHNRIFLYTTLLLLLLLEALIMAL